MPEATALTQGLRALGLDLPPPAQEQLLRYLALLQKWNGAYNLTAVRDPRAMLSRHLFDSLSVVPYVRGPRVMDAGTGAGLPGIPLAIAQPEIKFVLLDAAGKRMRFLHQVQAELQLPNVELVQARLEAYTGAPVDQMVSRAFTSLVGFAQLAAPYLAADGELLAMKATPPTEEIAVLARDYSIDTVSLAVPELDAPRCLVRLAPKG